MLDQVAQFDGFDGTLSCSPPGLELKVVSLLDIAH